MPALLTPGVVLRDRYEIIEFISQGGMGAIYRAEDIRLEGRMCALKEMWADSDATPEDIRQVQVQFHREASTLARLDHPNLPKVSDYFSENSRDYLVMDFVPGKDLKELMDQARADGQRLPESQVLNWAEQILDALEYLHNQNPPVLHRDIKPANIKLTPSGTIKLVDFGLVKVMVPDEDRTITVLQGRGTAQYTPLEQYGGDTGHTDIRSDIYSLGATLYHLITLQPPLDAKTRYLQPELFKAPSQFVETLSPRVERALLHAIAMHPGDRPVSIADLRIELLSSQPLELLAKSLSNGAASALRREHIVEQGLRWRHAFRENTVWLLMVLILLVVALVATALAPQLPPI